MKNIWFWEEQKIEYYIELTEIKGVMNQYTNYYCMLCKLIVINMISQGEMIFQSSEYAHIIRKPGTVSEKLQ